jgi:hypothetical protein
LGGLVDTYTGVFTTQLLESARDDYRIMAKEWDDTLEIWFSATDWSTQQSIPLANEAVPRESIVAPKDVKCLIYPLFPVDSGLQGAAWCFGRQFIGSKIPNPESPGWFVTAVRREGIQGTIPDPIPVPWVQPRQVQQAINVAI